MKRGREKDRERQSENISRRHLVGNSVGYEWTDGRTAATVHFRPHVENVATAVTRGVQGYVISLLGVYHLLLHSE